MNRADGWIYFIVAPEVNTVKIGYSSNVAARLKAIQASSPLKFEVMKLMRGNITTERAIFRRFADERKHGEWFDLTPRLKAFIEQLASGERLFFNQVESI